MRKDRNVWEEKMTDPRYSKDRTAMQTLVGLYWDRPAVEIQPIVVLPDTE